MFASTENNIYFNCDRILPKDQIIQDSGVHLYSIGLTRQPIVLHEDCGTQLESKWHRNYRYIIIVFCAFMAFRRALSISI